MAESTQIKFCGAKIYDGTICWRPFDPHTGEVGRRFEWNSPRWRTSSIPCPKCSPEYWERLRIERIEVEHNELESGR